MTNLVSSLHKYFIFSYKTKRILCMIVVVSFLVSGVLALTKKVSTKKAVVLFFLSCYLSMVFASTVFMRIDWKLLSSPMLKSFQYDIVPLHSYCLLLSGNKAYIQEVICNFLLLAPVGICITLLFGRVKIRKVIMLCGVISFAIEGMQLLYGCGLFEVDDLIHNVLGGAVGYFLCCRFLFYSKLLYNRERGMKNDDKKC